MKRFPETMPEVSVITAVKDGDRYLPETIDSILQQTHEDWEYLIVDDASSDGTAEIIRHYEKVDSRIKGVFLKKGVGPFVAANHGIWLAKGHFIARSDADDLAMKNRIERQLRYLKENSHLKICGSFGQRILEDSRPAADFFRPPQNNSLLKWQLCLRCELIHSSAFYERKAIIGIGGYRDLPASQDYRLWCEASRRNWVGVVPETLVYFRQHDDRLSFRKQDIQYQLGRAIQVEHLIGVTGEYWAFEEARALYAVGLGLKWAITPAIRAFNRWENRWKKDLSLTAEDTEELMRLCDSMRKRFLKRNARRQPFAYMKNRNNKL
jgi:glycosyltransferase involved in cell wall biosynthesis